MFLRGFELEISMNVFPNTIEKVVLAFPRGFCAGVDRAIDVVDQTLEIFGAPIYVKHEIVHNKHIVKGFEERGVIFTDIIEDIPEGSVCVYSAHGISPEIRTKAQARKLLTIDATCPLVTKIHLEVARYARENKQIIYIGHVGHPEAEGVLGIRPDITRLIEYPADITDELKAWVKDPQQLVFLTQTTLSIDETQKTIAALRENFKGIENPPAEDICYATTNRQTAIKQLAKVADIIIVVGSKNSSNSQRLRETAEKEGTTAYLVDDLSEVQPEWFTNKKALGLSSGASAPEKKVQEIADFFVQQGAKKETLHVLDEHMTFVMPRELETYRKEKKDSTP